MDAGSPSTRRDEALSDLAHVEAVRELVSRARGLVILTGAGVSADSGIPTFRSAGGLWGRHRPEDLATPEAFARDPRTVWAWYEERRRGILRSTPNPGHRAIARALLHRDDVTLVTQNVDGLHHRALTEVAADQRAGSDAGTRSGGALPRVLELHGNLLRSRCSECGAVDAQYREVDAQSIATLPRCVSCDGLMRPDVVWFGELLDQGVLASAFEAASASEVCVVVGTSAVVYPAAGIPLATLEAGGSLIQVNYEVTPLTTLCNCSLRGRSADLLPALFEAAREGSDAF